MSQKRQPKGIPVGGEFAANEHDEASSSLSGAQRSFEDISHETTDSDIAAGYATVSTEVSNRNYPNGEHSWKNVMGASAKMTDKNEEAYAEHMRGVIDADPELVAKVHRVAEQHAERNAYGRAYEQDAPIHPAAEEYFESVWNDPTHVYGEKKLHEEKQELARLTVGLEEGRVTPAKIIGSGVKNPKKLARQYLQRQTESVNRALETRGRSNGVLSSNANGAVRRATAGE